jgi:catechol 2,3-dioxygenase-like lactoylglutathione lyase family enzyme
MKTEIMFFVRDVEASSRWYQTVLGLKSGHGGPHYEMIVDEQKNLLFQLHHLDGDEHGDFAMTEDARRGAGVLVYLPVADVRAAFAYAKAAGANIRSEPDFIELAGHTEFLLHDPDGYAIAPYQRGKH